MVDCAFCPQRTLEKSYSGERILSLDNFKRVVDKLPQAVRVTFAGFTEPFLNRNCTDMVLYAHETGHKVSVFTTGVGMKPEDVYRLMNIPYFGYPNGGFCLHIPDAERIAKHPINKNFLATMKVFSEVHTQIVNFHTMCMGMTIHPDVLEYFPTSHVPPFYNRSGNLNKERFTKLELDKQWHRVIEAKVKSEPMTCGCAEKLYHNVMLPNGDVSLCCMDYGLEYILGNLYTQEYNDVVPESQSCFDLCKKCENGVAPKFSAINELIKLSKELE